MPRFVTDSRPISAQHPIAAGKAAPAMAAAAALRLGDAIRGGLVVATTSIPTDAETSLVPVFETIIGGHPLPTIASEKAGRRALALADATADAETLLVLISGGASALMAVPADGVTLDDKRAAT